MNDRFDNRRYFNADTFGVHSTAGAIPIKNEKGEVSMQKVKVQRYISGKRPDYANKHWNQDNSDDNISEDEDFISHRQRKEIKQISSHYTGTNEQSLIYDADQNEIEERLEIRDGPEDNLSSNQSFVKEIPATDKETRGFNGISGQKPDVNDPRLKRLMAVKQEAQTQPLCV
jgi:hypothetical protein